MTDNDWELEAQQAYERWLAVPVEASDAVSPKDDEDGYDWFERSCRNCFLAGYRAMIEVVSAREAQYIEAQIERAARMHGLPTESKT